MFRNRIILGKLGEYLARIFLRCKQYKIIATRYKNKYGEIDIIAQKQATLIFIEVKYRRDINYLTNVVNQKQKKRIQDCAISFINQHSLYNPSRINMRFDLIFINSILSIRHFKNAW